MFPSHRIERDKTGSRIEFETGDLVRSTAHYAAIEGQSTSDRKKSMRAWCGEMHLLRRWTFLFDSGHAHDVVDLFRVDSADHNTPSRQSSDFDDAIAERLRGTRRLEGRAVVLDLPADDDTVKLVNANRVSRGISSFQLGRLAGWARASAGPCCAGSRLGRRIGRSV